MVGRKFLIILALTFFLSAVSNPIVFAADGGVDLPSLTITFIESMINTPNAHTVRSFQPSVDLGTIAGLARGVMDKMLEIFFEGTGTGGGGLPSAQGFINQYVPSLDISPTSGSGYQNVGPRPSGSTVIMGNFTGNGTFIINPNQLSINSSQLGNNTAVISISPGQNVTTQSQNATAAPSVIFHTGNNTTMMILPAGTEYTVSNTASTSYAYHPEQNNWQFTTVGDYVEGLSYSLPLKIVLDTLWAPAILGGPEGNAAMRAKLKLKWNYTKGELNQINMQRAGGSMVPFGTIGQLSLSTEEFKFRRELGVQTTVGLSAVWKGKDKSLASISFVDIGMNIDDPSSNNNNLNDPLGAAGANHADSVFLSELADKIINALSSKSKSSAKSAGDESLGMKFVNKVTGNLGAKINVVQKTQNRKAIITFEVKAKDFSNKVYDLPVADNGVIVFDQENAFYPLNVTFPPDFPPLKEITVKVKSAKYTYGEIGYPEILITADFFPGEGVSTGPIMEGAGVFTNLNHEVTTIELTKPGITVSTDEQPVVIQVRGIVETGEPRIPLQGAQVRVFARGAQGHETVYADTLTGPPGDFIGDIVKTVKANQQVTIPNYIISVSKQGFGVKSSDTASANFVKTQVNPARYTIYLPLSPDQTFSLSGRVLEQDGTTGVAQAAVFAQIGRYGERSMAVTDANGNYNFPAIYAASLLIISAQKDGHNFEVKEYAPGAGSKSGVVDIKASTGTWWGNAKFTFTTQTGSLPAGVECKRASSPQSFGLAIPSGTTELAVVGDKKEIFTFSKDGYTFNPSSVTAEFTGNEEAAQGSARPKKEFTIAITCRLPSSVTLTADKQAVERYGDSYNPPSALEQVVISASVKDASGGPVANTNVCFEISGIEKIKVIRQGERPPEGRLDRAYAKTDSSGNASITVVAKKELGSVTFTPVAYDQYVTYVLRGSGYTLNIVENTRPERNAKPRSSFTLEAATLGLPGPGVRISKGGDILFHLNCDMNGVAGIPSGYNLRISRDNGAWQENPKSAFHPVDRMTFNVPGSYAVQFLVKRTFDEVDYWSDPAEATFTVVEYQPPEASLILPRNTGAVNIPVDYSFGSQVSAPYKKILLTFGDNKQDFDIDSGLLSGKFSWSGSYYHSYDTAGNYTITLKVIDQTDRFAEVKKTVTIGSVASLNDHAAPTGSISINSGAASTTGKGVLIRASATDNISGVYRIRYSNDGSTWSSWNSVAIDDRPYPSITVDRAWQLTDGAGTKTVYVQFKDAADNVSPTITDTIELQAAGLQISGTLPSPQVTITGYQGAPMPRGSIVITSRSGNNISVTFSATNDWAIFVNQMALSFNNQSWAGWMPFESNKQISLDGHLDATKIYVIFADGAGGQSSVYSADIPSGVSQNQQIVQGNVTQANQTLTQTNQTIAQTSTNQTGTQRVEGISSTAASGTQVQGTVRNQQRASARQVLGSTQSVSAVVVKDNRNNTAESGGNIDIAISDITAPSEANIAEPVEIILLVSNSAEVQVRDCSLTLESSDGFKEEQKLSLGPKARERIKIKFIPKEEGSVKITAELIAPPNLTEGNTRNNIASTRIKIRPKAQALAVTSSGQVKSVIEAQPLDIAINDIITPTQIFLGKPAEIFILIQNDSELELKDCQVYFETEDGFREKQLFSLKPRSREKIVFRWIPSKTGRLKINAGINASRGVEEKNIRNNESRKLIEVISSESRVSAGGLLREEKPREDLRR